MDEYQALLEKALADEISTVRLYLAAMAKAPPGDVATLLESKLTGKPVDYAAMIGGAD